MLRGVSGAPHDTAGGVELILRVSANVMTFADVSGVWSRIWSRPVSPPVAGVWPSWAARYLELGGGPLSDGVDSVFRGRASGERHALQALLWVAD